MIYQLKMSSETRSKSTLILCCAFGVLTSCVPAPKHEMSWERINIKPADSVGLCDKPKAALQINDDPSRSTVSDENLKEKVNVGSVRTAKIDKKFVDRRRAVIQISRKNQLSKSKQQMRAIASQLSKKKRGLLDPEKRCVQ